MVDHVKKHKVGLTLEPQDASPSNAQEGQMQMASASHATLSQGMYRYDGTEWKAAGGGVGSLTLIKAYKSNDDGTGDFTVKSIDSLLPDFAATDTLAASFSGSSTGDALFSNDNADKVYNLKSAASSQYDAVGFDLSIPKYARGKDIGFSMFFRTKDVSGDSANADYMVWIFDKTNGIQTTTIDTGAIAAGTSINITTSTGMSVGQKIFVEEASQVVETHITAIADSTHVTLSDAVTLATGDLLATGILTDTLTTLKAADSDTNEIGEKFQVTFLPPEDCSSVTFMVQQLTSETDSELYFDALGFDSDPFHKLSTTSKFELTEKILSADKTSSGDIAELQFDNLIIGNTYEVTGTSLIQSYIAAIGKLQFYSEASASGTLYGSTWHRNGNASLNKISAGPNFKFTALTSTMYTYANLSAAEAKIMGDGTKAETYIQVSTVPSVNESVIVESTDSVVSAWEAYTPTFQGLGTVTSIDVKWRRVGSVMEVQGTYVLGTTTASLSTISLPIGQVIDDTGTKSVGTYFRGGSSLASSGGPILLDSSLSTSILYYADQAVFSNGAVDALSPTDVTGTSGNIHSISFSVPIAGWSASPTPLLALPTITVGQEPESYICTDSAIYSSSNTALPYFQTISENTINNLGTVVNDSTNGFIFTATTRCNVVMTHRNAYTAAGYLGISKNATASELDTSINSIAETKIVAMVFATTGNVGSESTFSGILEPGDVLACHAEKSKTTATGAASQGVTLLVAPISGQSNQAAIIAQPVVYVKDVKSSGTAGGTATSGSFQTRDLNQLSGDIAAVGVSLSSNQFTLGPGKYSIDIIVPSYYVGIYKSKLYNITDSKDSLIGTTEDSAASSSGWQTHSFIKGILTLTSEKTFEVRHRVTYTQPSNGFGRAVAYSLDEIYTQVKITRTK